MDSTDAAVIMYFVPTPIRAMWHEAAITRAERDLERTQPDTWETILNDKGDYGFAIELVYLGDEVGQYGHETNYHVRSRLDDDVLEADGVDIDPAIAKEFASRWAEQVIDVLQEVEDDTMFSSRELATLVTMHGCNEQRAADALGVSVGTYRGKKGRVAEKFRRCTESDVLRQLVQHGDFGQSSRRTLGDHDGRITDPHPTNLYERALTASNTSPWRYPREDLRDRDQDTYEQSHWRTADVESIDRTSVTASDRDDNIRIEFDGAGRPGGDVHRQGENLRISAEMNPHIARRFYTQLGTALPSRERAKTLTTETIMGVELEVGDTYDVVGPTPFVPSGATVEILGFRPGIGDEPLGVLLQDVDSDGPEDEFAGRYAVGREFADAADDGRLSPTSCVGEDP
jgi:hypothetical protein